MSIPDNSTPMNLPPYTPVYRRESSLAVASLICGITTWFFIPFLGAIAAVITGHLAKKEIRESNGMLTGDGMAVAGLILGYIQLGLILLGIVGLAVFLIALASGVTSTITGPATYLFHFMV
jgi:hypothetical protein